MTSRIAYLEAVIGADITQFRKGMRDVRNETGILSETIGGLGRLGRTLTFAYTAPLLALGSYATQASAQFDASMRNINAIAGLTESELSDLSDRMIDFGRDTREGVTASADALYTVFSAGLTDAETAFKAMEVSVRTAEAGLADTTTTTEALVAVMLSYGDTTEAFMNRASDAMTQMVAVGVGSMQDFASGMSNVIPTASAMGMSIEELMGNMAFLTQRGLSASKASTSLNSALTALAKPTTAMQEAFRELGYDGAEALIEGTGSVNNAFKALIGTTNGSQEQLQALFNNIRGARAINQFANNLDAWDESMRQFNESLDGATMRAWEQQSSSFMATWDRFTSSLEASAIVIGQELMPYIRPVLAGMTDLLDTITDGNPALLTMGTAFTILTAVVPPLLWIFSSLVTPVGLLVAGVTTLAMVFGSKLNTALQQVLTSSAQVKAQVRGLLQSFDAVFGTDLWDAPEGMSPMERLLASLTGGSTNATEALQQAITPDSPVSLWSIFEDGKYFESMSWDEFMDLATEGGWEGGAITPDKPLFLSLGGGSIDTSEVTSLGNMYARQAIEQTQAMDELYLANLSWFERTRVLYDRYGSELTSSFNAIWNELLTVAVPMATDFVDGLVNAIGNMNFEKIPDAIRQALTGDLEGAFTTLFGEGNTSFVKDLLTDLFSSDVDTSGLTDSIANLFTVSEDAIVNKVLPALARTFGYVAGRIGFFMGEFFSNLPAIIKGEGGELGRIFDESIAQPMAEGFAQASEDTGNAIGAEGSGGTWLTNTVNNWLGGLALGAILVPNSLWIPVVAKLASSLVMVVKTGLGTALATLGFGSAIKAGLASAWGGAVASLKAGLASLSAIVIPTGVAIMGAIAGGIFAGFAIHKWVIPQETKDQVFNDFWESINSIFGRDTENGDNTVQQDLENMLVNVIQGALDGITWDEFWDLISWTGVPFSGFTSWIAENLFSSGEDGDVGALNLIAQWMQAQIDNFSWSDLQVPEWAQNADENLRNWLGNLFTGGNNQTLDRRDRRRYKTNSDSSGDAPAKADNLPPSAMEDLFGLQAVIDNELIPFENEWMSRFGEEGTIPSAFSTTTDLINAQAIRIGAIFQNMIDSLSILDAWGIYVVNVLSMVNTKLEKVADGMNSVSLATSSLPTGGFTAPPAPIDGSHAGGLANVPFDGYLAELHKGERVLTAGENRQLMKGSLATGANSSTETNMNTTNYITVQGVQDVDGLLNDLRRRGINLGINQR